MAQWLRWALDRQAGQRSRFAEIDFDGCLTDQFVKTTRYLVPVRTGHPLDDPDLVICCQVGKATLSGHVEPGTAQLDKASKPGIALGEFPERQVDFQVAGRSGIRISRQQYIKESGKGPGGDACSHRSGYRRCYR